MTMLHDIPPEKATEALAREANRARQKAFRERQKAKGLHPLTLNVTSDERFYLERVLWAMREGQAVPCAMRGPDGKFRHLDT